MCLFVHMCTVSRVKSKRFHCKVNSRCFCSFPAAILVDQSGPPTWRFNTKLYKVACHASANDSETMYHKDVRPGEVVYVLVFYNIFMFLAFFIERLRIYFFMAWQWKRYTISWPIENQLKILWLSTFIDKLNLSIDNYRVLSTYRLRFRWSTLIDILRPVIMHIMIKIFFVRQVTFLTVPRIRDRWKRD